MMCQKTKKMSKCKLWAKRQKTSALQMPKTCPRHCPTGTFGMNGSIAMDAEYRKKLYSGYKNTVMHPFDRVEENGKIGNKYGTWKADLNR